MDDNNKKLKSDIDEAKMMNLMVDGVRKEGFDISAEEITEKKKAEGQEQEKPLKKVHTRPKSYSRTDYEEIFFKDVKSTARHGKSVYIDPDHHKKLSRIVQVIGDNNTTIYAYLYNLLDHHFGEFEESITTSFNEKNKPIF
ncbi:DUF3408 domain-containing protein [Epilithonimonas ginsengisoli]|uniref:Conjugal transfer protein TraB n=2 Tax=Epilithonimonas TaxID=2782229 RepID=A0A085B5S5_9FLAO|nr:MULTISPECIES: DUF3408 domain-containing protein [Chryseobacterium group]KFC17820.1 conjugal transfer protein TraB [Epilithonimonas lactis]MBV6879052.1 DUF3408 domain-containing protein [Epilithonimonas sp. FP105]MDW8547899.1 DUF3408 domain-containing protein [Epilithonimonas ginsengisoli]OAH74960.1 conjugal transfer protein TraB [Chryseobacterium sp. FP211-J200]SEQ99113.1 Protein of unknown function [Epilithonimonas lactis]